MNRFRDTFEQFQDPERGLFGENELDERREPSHRPRVNGASDLIDLTLKFQLERPNAIAVTDPARPKFDDRRQEIWTWLPKSQVEFVHESGGRVLVTIPRWLAEEKGLV